MKFCQAWKTQPYPLQKQRRCHWFQWQWDRSLSAWERKGLHEEEVSLHTPVAACRGMKQNQTHFPIQNSRVFFCMYHYIANGKDY